MDYSTNIIICTTAFKLKQSSDQVIETTQILFCKTPDTVGELV